MPSFRPSQLEVPESTNVEHKPKQAGLNAGHQRVESPEAGAGPEIKVNLRPPILWTAICQHITKKGLVSKCSKNSHSKEGKI